MVCRRRLFKLTAEERAALNEAIESHHQCCIDLKNRQKDYDASETKSDDDEMKMKEAQTEIDRARKADAKKSSDETKAALATAMKEADEAAARLK